MKKFSARFYHLHILTIFVLLTIVATCIASLKYQISLNSCLNYIMNGSFFSLLLVLVYYISIKLRQEKAENILKDTHQVRWPEFSIFKAIVIYIGLYSYIVVPNFFIFDVIEPIRYEFIAKAKAGPELVTDPETGTKYSTMEGLDEIIDKRDAISAKLGCKYIGGGWFWNRYYYEEELAYPGTYSDDEIIVTSNFCILTPWGIHKFYKFITSKTRAA